LIEAMPTANRPSRAHQYMIYQTLLGACPLAGPDRSFVERMQAYVVKAAREAKEQTSWLNPDSLYEEGLTTFVEQLLDQEGSRAFLDSFEPFVSRVALLGALNSLSQLALKLGMPGVPDLYQGTEFWDLSLVDPDNRRSVDFRERIAALSLIGEQADWEKLAHAWPDGRIKLALMRALLTLRERAPALFTEGGYRAVDVTGPHRNEVIAFARTRGRDAVIVAVGRLFGRATQGGRHWPSGSAWDAELSVGGFEQVRNVVGTRHPSTGPCWPTRDLFHTIPVAVFEARIRVNAKPLRSLESVTG
jgi:(1->4)-alpha-D-glucan 1-alpha-D-glucosylmutase